MNRAWLEATGCSDYAAAPRDGLCACSKEGARRRALERGRAAEMPTPPATHGMKDSSLH